MLLFEETFNRTHTSEPVRRLASALRYCVYRSNIQVLPDHGVSSWGDLMDYICYRRKLGEVEVRKFIRQTVSAVHYLHQGGILHR